MDNGVKIFCAFFVTKMLQFYDSAEYLRGQKSSIDAALTLFYGVHSSQ